MNWTEVSFRVAPLEPWRDLLIAELGDLGFDGFEETEHGLRAYIRTELYDPLAVRGSSTLNNEHVQATFTAHQVPPRNWNAEWERSFQPVEVGKQVRVRAEFHLPVEGFTHDIVITPRMAFGTGHHATTRMMVEAMSDLDLKDRRVCDLGCGTAVLAILAERMGAKSVRAIDIDEQAVINARENVALNGCQRIAVDKGDVALLVPGSCEVILANIERNTLLRDMDTMRDALVPGGVLLLSGFVNEDRDRMQEAVMRSGMHPAEVLSHGEWSLIGCRK